MRNLKRILSAALAMVMSLSIATVASAAVDFKDAEDINYDEAVAVMSTIGVLEGYNGEFDPAGSLTREQAAKIVAFMILGNNANKLAVDESRYTDVAADRWSAGVIEFCSEQGILAGLGNGTYNPEGKLTGYEFAKMLLCALGYDADIEGFVGNAWKLNVANYAMEIGLDNGIEDIDWAAEITREKAAQMAMNAVKSPLVQYDKGATIIIDGQKVTFGSGDAYYVTSTLAKEQRISTARLTNSNDYTVEFGEKYFPNLSLKQISDEFERPARTWIYENEEIGTYVNTDLLVEEYTTGVSGKDLYNLLSSNTIKEYSFEYYVDGVKSDVIAKENMTRSHTNNYTTTGNGVLTEVFVDHDNGSIVITSMNTYLAQATANYNENSDTVALKVYSDTTGTTKTVDGEIVANISDIVKDEYVLVNMSQKDRSVPEVVVVSDVEILEGTTITEYSKGTTDKEQNKDYGFFKSVVANGEKYDAAKKANYNDEVLNLYDAALLTDATYNVYLDQYGYAIGLDLHEGEAQYVFITGYDRPKSHISIKTAVAGAIFTDGTMDEITVNVTDTNKYIDKVDSITDRDYDAHYHQWGAAGYTTAEGGEIALNTWYSYTVDANEVYTLKPVAGRMIVGDKADGSVVNSANVRLTDAGANGNAYGNDDSKYITVEAGTVDKSVLGLDAITEVDGLYTGVQNVELEFLNDVQENVANDYFVLKDSNDYIIAAVVLADAKGGVKNYAYILDEVTGEKLIDGNYYWTFKAIMDGKVVTLTAKSKYTNTISGLNEGSVQELRFDGDYVVDVKNVNDSKIIKNYNDAWNDDEVFDVTYGSVHTLDLKGRTFKTTNSADLGLTLVSETVPTVLTQTVNGSSKTVEYGSLAEAFGAMADAQPSVAGQQFKGRIVAALDNLGRAEWVYVISDTPVTTGGGNIGGGSGKDFTFTSNIFDTGFATVALTADRPEYITNTSALDYSFDVYVNGAPYGTGNGTIAAGKDTGVATWNNNTNFYYRPIKAGDNITIENFAFTATGSDSLATQDYVLKIVDQYGNDLSSKLSAPNAVGGYVIPADSTVNRNITFNTGLYATDEQFKVTKIENATYTGTLPFTGTIGGTPELTINGLKANTKGYVTITVDTTGMDADTNVYLTGFTAKALSTAPWSIANETMTLAVSPKASSVVSGGRVDIEVATAGSVGVAANEGYRVQIEKLGFDEVFTNAVTKTVTVTADANITVTAADVKVTPIAKFAVQSGAGKTYWSEDGRSIIVTFNQNVDASTATTTNITESTGFNGSVDIDNITVRNNVMTITLKNGTLDGTAGVVTLSTNVDDVYGCALASTTLTIGASGAVTVA